MVLGHLKRLLLSFFMLSLFTPTLLAANRCERLIQPIRRAHYYYFGLDFPYWYSVAQAQQESSCRQIISKDGIGSIGFAQITWKWWKNRLKSAGIPEIYSIKNHAKAQAFINHYEYKRTYCKKLFEMYQRYNGGSLVTIELKRAKSCRWIDGYRACKRKKVCVYRRHGKCKQWRSSCDINYGYSLNIYKKAEQYRIAPDNPRYPFW